MKLKLQTEEEKHGAAANGLNKSSRFFNKKEQGEPIVRHSLVKEIDKRVNSDFCFEAYLCHPLWQLIDNPNPTTESINQVLSHLPMSYVNLLFKEGLHGNLVRKRGVKYGVELANKMDIHALTCWIAFCLESPRPQLASLDINQLSAIKYLIKIALITPFAAITKDFYLYINTQFAERYIDIPHNAYDFICSCETSSIDKLYLPMRLITKGTVDLQPILTLYQQLCQRAIQVGIVSNSSEGQNQFYSFICHSEIQVLTDILYQEKYLPDSLSALKDKIFQRTLFAK
jgi:hypothetical protein